MNMPIPWEPAPPRQTNFLHQGLNHFKPHTNFKLLRIQVFHQIHIYGINQRVILQQKRTPEVIALHQLDLLADGQHQIYRIPGFAVPDKVDNIDNLTFFHSPYSPLLFCYIQYIIWGLLIQTDSPSFPRRNFPKQK